MKWAHPAKRHSRTNQSSGFTVAELMVVVVILIVIAAVAIPVLAGQAAKAKDSATRSSLASISRLLKTANVDDTVSGADCTSTGDIVTTAGRISKNGAIVCADIVAHTFCISQTGSSGTTWALTAKVEAPYVSSTGCTSASSIPLDPGTNILTQCEASFESYATCATANGLTPGWSQATALNGTSSLKLTINAPSWPWAWIGSPTVNPITAIPNQTYTAVASMKAGTYHGKVALLVNYWAQNGTTDVGGSGSMELTDPTTWTQASVTTTAPANAKKISIRLVILSAGPLTQNQYYYVDQVGLWKGTSTTWALPAS